MSNIQNNYHFKLDFPKVDKHTGGKWLIHGTKRRKDNQLQSLELNIFSRQLFLCVPGIFKSSLIYVVHLKCQLQF